MLKPPKSFKIAGIGSAALLALVACGTGAVEASDSPGRERGFGDASGSAPFPSRASPADERLNSSNDGTDFEPCGALSDEELESLGVDPNSVKDAASVVGQSLRGCDWRYVEPPGLMLSQFVGNAVGGIGERKQVPSSLGDTWLPDTKINGRVVGLRTQQRGGECATFVESGEAVVITMVLDMPPALPDTDLCALALRFTEATIDKMPL